MKKDGLLAEILSAVVKRDRRRAEASQYDEILNPKKQMWYGIMNQIEPEEDSTDDDKAEP